MSRNTSCFLHRKNSHNFEMRFSNAKIIKKRYDTWGHGHVSHFLQRKTRVVSKMSSGKFGEERKLLEIVWKKRLSALADFKILKRAWNMANKSKGKIKITTSYLPTDSNQPARKVIHRVWKSQKKSHSTLRAKRATFTF